MPSFELLESLLLEEGRLFLLAGHMQRLANSAQYYGFRCDREAVCQQLLALAKAHPHGRYKIRLCLDSSGRVQTELSELAPQAHVAYQWAEQAMDSRNTLLYHKTTARDHFPPAPPGRLLLFCNEAGQVTEFNIANVAVSLGGQWYTPPISAGLLPGVMRAHLLEQGRLKTRILYRQDVVQADQVMMINSVRGLLPACHAEAAT